MHPLRRPRSSQLIAALLLVGALAALVAGCGSSGRELREPAPGATAQTRVPDPTSSSSTSVRPTGTAGTAPGFTLPTQLPVFEVTSPDLAAGEVLPEEFACGSTTAPRLSWAAPPAETAELAVFAVDLDSGEILWAVTGIPGGDVSLDGSALPAGAVVSGNSQGAAGWDGPCVAGGTHTLQFEVVALGQADTPVTGGPRDVRDAAFARAIAYGILSTPVRND